MSSRGYAGHGETSARLCRGETVRIDDMLAAVEGVTARFLVGMPPCPSATLPLPSAHGLARCDSGERALEMLEDPSDDGRTFDAGDDQSGLRGHRTKGLRGQVLRFALVLSKGKT